MKFEKIISDRFYNHSKTYGKYFGFLSMLGMGIGSFAIIISISVMNGFENIVYNKLKGFEGDIRVLQNNSDLQWREIEGVDVIMPFMERKIIIKANGESRVVSMKAVNEKVMPKFYKLLINGFFPSIGEILIGQDLAHKMGLEIGDEVIASSPIDQTIGLTIPNKNRYLVSGTFSTKVLNFDDQLIFGTISDGRRLFNRKKMIDGYDLRVKKNYSITDVKKKISDRIGNEFSVLSWDDQNKSLVNAMKMERYATIIILSLIFVVSSFNLVSNLSLISIQKTREIGILISMGASSKSIQHIVMRLGFKRAGIGALIGFFTGLTIIIIQRQFSIISLPSEVYLIETLPMIIYQTDILLVLLISFSFIYMASYFSGKKAFTNKYQKGSTVGEVILNVDNVNKTYGSEPNSLQVLKNFNLKLYDKEIITISGQSGCGKSTALNIMSTLDKQDSGKIFFKGKNIDNLEGESLSKFRNTKIGFVFQFHHLIPDLTALENASIPIWISKKPVLKNDLIDLFKFLGVANKINHFPSQLSGGERSKVALIRAIINKPSILFADEPTGNLDEKSSIKLVDLLLKINKDFGQSIILTTHNPDVAMIGNKNFILDNGSLH